MTETQAAISAEIAQLAQDTRAGDDLGPRLDYPPYRSSVLRHPTHDRLPVDPDTLELTGVIDAGRLGVADRYTDLALVQAQLDDEWSVDATGFFAAYGLSEPDAQRLAFYLLLDPLTWG
jgi:hypothetical protein